MTESSKFGKIMKAHISGRGTGAAYRLFLPFKVIICEMACQRIPGWVDITLRLQYLNRKMRCRQTALDELMEVKKHMARIAGVDLPREKRVEIGLTYIYGIGRVSSNRILAEANVDPNTRCRDLTDDEVKRISEVIDNTQTVEGDLRREIAMNIKRLQEIGCYRGIRHRKGLPVRGQKTKTNARTRKGPKRTVANKKK